MIRLGILLLALFSTTWLSAQNYETEADLSAAQLKALAKVRTALNGQDYPTADEELGLVLADAPRNIDLLLMRASVRDYRRDTLGALADYTRAVALAPDYEPAAWYYLALNEQALGRYAAAAEHFDAFLQRAPADHRRRPEAERRRAAARYAAELVANPVPYRPEALPPTINTEEMEYFPTLSIDRATLVFTRRVNGFRGDENLFFSVRDSAGTWLPAEPLPGINTANNEAAQTLSADRRTLVFVGCNRPDGYGNCDLYLSDYRNGAWSRPTNLGPPVNTPYWDSHPSLSANGRWLFFSSNRPGGQGEADIWVSSRRNDGSWTAPVNLGSVVNTPLEDRFPFFHPDGKTLYFSSEGHPGMGGLDIFRTELDSAGIWQPPQNLGYPINNSGDDTGFYVEADGRRGFFAASERANPKSDTDIYTFELPPSARPNPVTYVLAQVSDAVTGQPLTAHLELRRLEPEEILDRRPTTESGTFLVVLPLGETYAMNVYREGYTFESRQFQLTERAEAGDPFRLEIALRPLAKLETGQTIVLENILFRLGQAELLPASETELNRLLEILREEPALRLIINGHTDNIGSEAANQALSEARARAVYDWLVDRGIAANRLESVGFGESRPLESNDTAEGRARNRRTEIGIL